MSQEDSAIVMETEEYAEVPEEVVETSYMCGECFLLFPTTDDFNLHECPMPDVSAEGNETESQEVKTYRTTTIQAQETQQPSHASVFEARESEAAMEEAVASILGERMKRMAPQSHASNIQINQELIEPVVQSIEHAGILETGESVVEHTVIEEHPDSSDGVIMDAVEIPSANIYMYDNPVYLNRLMKDNTFGRRVRHDAPYAYRLGPWDNKSSRLLIHLLKEYPRAYFILDKECKRTEAWEIIRLKLVEAGYQFTVLQIRMRWRELVKKYRNTVNQNELHKTHHTCEYFEEMNTLFGVWDRPATLLLIRQLDAHSSKRLGQNGGTRMRHKVWEHIRQFLSSHGYQYTADQVQGRWSTLVTLYQRMIEHNSKSYNEPITIAYKDYIERVFKYVPERNIKWLKIMEKRGRTPKALTRKWTLPIERVLLAAYRDRVYRFNNEHINNTLLWAEIAQQLEEESGYNTTLEKVRMRFYELTKQFAMVEQHNAQPGTIQRECKHHDTLMEIYSIYGYWPHDHSTIKLDKSSAIRIRQVNAQLSWSEDESRALLQLYPQVLVSHVSNGDHQPVEELWLQLAKAYLSHRNDRKHCYEIEEHMALLRRGYKSRNPFPFTLEMQLVEETESTLGFKPDTSQLECDQLVPYWSHRAAYLLLDLTIDYRQEGVRNAGLFELISRDLAGYGYRYTGEECRVYYSLLRQVYTNRVRTIKRNKELMKPFPYMEKMAEVDSVVCLPRYSDCPSNQKKIIAAAQMKLENVEGDTEEVRRDHLMSMLTKLKIHLKRNNIISPPPSVKQMSRILAERIESTVYDQNQIIRLHSILRPHLNLLNIIAERSDSESAAQNSLQGETKKSDQPKYSPIQWSESNLRIMLSTIQEWRLMCHDTHEFESMLGSGQPLWKEVASRLSGHYRVCPAKCQERLTTVLRQYKSVVSFNALLGPDEPGKFVKCQDTLDVIFTPIVSIDAELDARDGWWTSDENVGWNRNDTLELLFTVREIWPGSLKVDWDLVSLLMDASGCQRDAKSCEERFTTLYNDYLIAYEHNASSLRARRRPPFYFKLYSLFNTGEQVLNVDPEPNGGGEVDVDQDQLVQALVQGLMEMKVNHNHSVPRRPLLLALAQHLNICFQNTGSSITPYQVWHILVQLHNIHKEALAEGAEVSQNMNLGQLWQDSHSALLSFGFHAVPIPGWEKVCEWTMEEIYLLLEAVMNWCLQPGNQSSDWKKVGYTSSELLLTQGYQKTSDECLAQWQYMVSTYKHGGYRQFVEQMNLVYLLEPSMFGQHLLEESSSTSSKSSRGNSGKIGTWTKTSQSPEIRIIASPSQRKLDTGKEENQKIHIVSPPESGEQGVSDYKFASGDVSSYVNINESQSLSPERHNIQVSTDEVDWWEDENNSNLMVFNDKKEETNSHLSHKSSSSAADVIKITVGGKKGNVFNGHGVHESSSPDMKSESSCTRKESDTFSFQCMGSSDEDRVLLEVLSVEINDNSKLVKCRTAQDVVPARTIKLHYAPDHPLPPRLSHMYVPRIMVHPELVTGGASASKEQKSSQPKTVFKSSVGDEKSSGTRVLPTEVIDVKEEPRDSYTENHIHDRLDLDCDDPNLDDPDDPDTIDHMDIVETKKENTYDEPSAEGSDVSDKAEVIDLLAKYRSHCRDEKNRLLALIQQSHQQQTSVLKSILNVFQELQSAL